MVITLLRSLYDPAEPLPEDEGFYRAVMEDVDLFHLHAQLYQLLKETDALEQVPVFFRKQLKQAADRVLFQNLALRHTEETVFRRFEERGIGAIPLKGNRFAERFFGHFAARPTSDIDLLVHPAGMDQAVECLRGMGFAFDKKVHNHTVMRKVVEGSSLPVEVELHWTLDKKYWSELHDGPFWEHSVPYKEFRYIRELSVPHTFYHICLHGIRHRMDSVRFVMDIAQMIHRCGSGIDIDAVFGQALQDRTVRRVQAALSIVYQQLPHFQRSLPLPFPLLDTHWDYGMFRDMQKGLRKMDYKYRLFFKFRIFDTWKHTILSQRQLYNYLMQKSDT